MKAMHMVTHSENTAIPEGLAALSIDDRGWVGTNNGWPFAGQPALFPIPQANALMYAWNAFSLGLLPAPENVPDDVKEWLT